MSEATAALPAHPCVHAFLLVLFSPLLNFRNYSKNCFLTLPKSTDARRFREQREEIEDKKNNERACAGQEKSERRASASLLFVVVLFVPFSLLAFVR